MARKVASEEVDDLSILHPETQLTLSGREIQIHEYGFVEGLKAKAKSRDFLNDLSALVEQSQLTLADLTELFSKHLETVIQLIATATDVEPEWIKSLNDSDGEQLLLTWWTINSPFFVRRLQLLQLTQQRSRLNEDINSDGVMSTPN